MSQTKHFHSLLLIVTGDNSVHVNLCEYSYNLVQTWLIMMYHLLKKFHREAQPTGQHPSLLLKITNIYTTVAALCNHYLT